MSLYKQVAAMAMLSVGGGAGWGGFNDANSTNHTMPRDITYTHTPEPLSKRAKRRLRGKGKQP